MEDNTVVNPSSENAGTPQNAPAGGFVASGQMPGAPVTPIQESVSQTVEAPVVSQTQPEQIPSTEVKKEGALDNFFKGVTKFIAKVSGQPDPITGEANPASQVLQKSQNVVGKVRDAANQAVEKAGSVANQTVGKVGSVASKTTAAVNQVTEKIQNVIPNTGAPVQAPVEPVVQTPAEPIIQAPVEQIVQAPVEPVVQVPIEPVVQVPVEQPTPTEEGK